MSTPDHHKPIDIRTFDGTWKDSHPGCQITPAEAACDEPLREFDANDEYAWPDSNPDTEIAHGFERVRETMSNTMRNYPSGATRGAEEGKLDYEGFLSPLVLRRYAQYMEEHRRQADGKTRPSDNWQKGIPRDDYMKSKLRHDIDMWIAHDSGTPDENAVCAVLFNTMGYLLELLKKRDTGVVNGT